MTTLLSICFIPSFACVSRVVYSTERGKKISESSSSENPLGNYIRLKDYLRIEHIPMKGKMVQFYYLVPGCVISVC